MRVRHEIWLFCKAQATAYVASVVDFAVSLILAEAAGVWYLYSTFCGAVSGGVVNCVMNYRWVFDAEGLKKKAVAVKYFMVWTGSILLNTLGTYALTEWSGKYFIYAKIVVALLVGFLWNYQLQRLFVYRDMHIREKLHKLRKEEKKQS